MLEGLSEQQKDAVLTEGHVLLTACPGSGKTRVLTYKVGYELQKIEEKKKVIVALTFTNRASDEIKRRIVRMDIDPTKLWAGTIHAFCLEWILRPYASYLTELKNGFVIVDEYKAEELLAAVKADFNVDWWVGITTRLNTDGSFAESKNQYHELLTEYHSRLKANKLIDFDQLIYYAFKLITSYPKIAKTLNNIFHLICVDEYQDTQNLQYAILAEIIQVDNSKTLLFLVGDRDQAIYGSLGGVAKSLAEIQTEFGGIEIQEKELSGNYRSSQRVIDYYRNYQSTNINIESLSVYANDRGLITFSETIAKDDLDKHIAAVIQQNLAAGIPEHEICVLAPQWYLIIPMGRKLKTLLPNVNFDAYGLSPLIKNRENIWFKVARLFLVEPSPKMHLIRRRWAEELINELNGIGVKILDDEERKGRKLLKIINSIHSANEDGLTYLEECFGALLISLEIKIEEYPALSQHWEYFFEGTRKRLEKPEFDYAKDIISFKRLFRHNSGVVVNTCHGIKGEEFHTVIAFGLLQGYIPHDNEDSPEEAAKKLLYVICSRSKRNLHLISERRTRRRQFMNSTLLLAQVNYTYD